MQYITLSEIYTKIKSKDDIINYFREQGKIINNNKWFRTFFPKLSCYDNRFFLEVLQGKKKVKYYVIYV